MALMSTRMADYYCPEFNAVTSTDGGENSCTWCNADVTKDDAHKLV